MKLPEQSSFKGEFFFPFFECTKAVNQKPCLVSLPSSPRASTGPHFTASAGLAMDVDVKSSLGPYGAGGNPKKRPISFRLTVPSKRQSLPYHQRSSAATSHTFYVSKDGSAEPDTPSSITDEDPFYDSDAEPVALFLSNEFESPFSQSFEQVEREKKPRFTKPVMLGPSLSSSDNSASPGASSYRPLFRSPDSVLERLEKAYEVVESNDLFKDSPLWQALLEAKKSGPEGAFFQNMYCLFYYGAYLMKLCF